MGMMARLVIYAIQIIIGIKIKDYFILPIILLSLFNFQICYVIIEFIANYNHYKKRMKDG